MDAMEGFLLALLSGVAAMAFGISWALWTDRRR